MKKIFKFSSLILALICLFSITKSSNVLIDAEESDYKTYTMTIDSSKNGVNNVHVVDTSGAFSEEVTYQDVNWTITSNTGTIGSTKIFKVGTNDTKDLNLSISTDSFLNKKIKSVTVNGYQTNTFSNYMTMSIGDTSIYSSTRLEKEATDYTSTNTSDIIVNDNLTISITNTKGSGASLLINSISVVYQDISIENVSTMVELNTRYTYSDGLITNTLDNTTITIPSTYSNVTYDVGSYSYLSNICSKYDGFSLRSSDNSGIVSTKADTSKHISSVKIIFDSSTDTSRQVDIYGSNTAYTSINDLYSTDTKTKGTLISSIVYDGSELNYSVAIDESYDYIGIRSKKNALYITSIEINYEYDEYQFVGISKYALRFSASFSSDEFNLINKDLTNSYGFIAVNSEYLTSIGKTIKEIAKDSNLTNITSAFESKAIISNSLYNQSNLPLIDSDGNIEFGQTFTYENEAISKLDKSITVSFFSYNEDDGFVFSKEKTMSVYEIVNQYKTNYYDALDGMQKQIVDSLYEEFGLGE